MLVIGLIITGILLRFAPHAPNFTPLAAIALFSGVYLNKKYGLLVPLAIMITSDTFMGLHNVIFFTWGSFALTALLGMRIKKQKNFFNIASASVGSAILFYIISNFGVWAMGWYPRNLAGLVNCYVMALPFLRIFTLSTLIYSGVFFGIYELAARLVKDTKYSRVLLTD